MEFHDNQANYLKSCGTISQTPPEILDSIPINSEDAKEVRIFYLQACPKIRHLNFFFGLQCGDTPTSVQLMKDAVLLEENSSEL